MKTERDILVIGGGKFGCLAVERLKTRVDLVVEENPSQKLKDFGVEILPQDGIKASVSLLSKEKLPSYLVPAIPEHFVAQWLRLYLLDYKTKILSLPELDLRDITSVISGDDHKLYLSMADFLCPDNCPEPKDHCSVTGKKRPSLFKRLAQIDIPGWSVAIVRSHQLAPGVGGFKVPDLLALAEKIKKNPGKWLIGASCRCHGVIQGIEFIGPLYE